MGTQLESTHHLCVFRGEIAEVSRGEEEASYLFLSIYLPVSVWSYLTFRILYLGQGHHGPATSAVHSIGDSKDGMRRAEIKDIMSNLAMRSILALCLLHYTAKGFHNESLSAI